MFGSTLSPKNNPPGGKPTAEERLLQVIQSEGEPVAAGKENRWEKVSQQFSRLSPKRIWEAFQPRGPGPSGQKPVWRFDLAWVNKALGTVTALALVSAIGNAFFLKPDIGGVYGQVERFQAPGGERTLPQSVPVEEYVASITGRNLFQPSSAEVVEPASAPAAVTPLGVLDNLQLVGIAWGVYPEAMIRDKKGGRTHFLKQGEKLREVLVKEILKDRVIVEYEGQDRELM